MAKKTTVIESFKNAKKAEKFVNKMQKKGYVLVDLTDGKKHYSIVRGVGVGMITGGIGLVAGRGRSRFTVTMTLKDEKSLATGENEGA